MSYQDFRTIADVQRRYNIVYDDAEFISPLPVTPSPSFLEDYEFSIEHLDVLISEASRCENIIYPVLRDVYRHYANELSLWSHKPFGVDDVLTGTPDYLISLKSPLGKTVLDQPLLIVVEAKKSDFEQGWGQCLAAMVAAQRLNGSDLIPIFGIVTDGQLWQFGKLLRNHFILNKSSVATSDLNRLFASINSLLQQALAVLEPA
jgi:hypothetical protein